MHPPTVMPSHIESYTDCVSTLQLSIAGLANHHHSSLCCCSIVQTVRPGSSHNICLAFFRSVGLTGHCTNCFPLAACYDSNSHLLLGHTDLHQASHSKTYAHQGLPDIHRSIGKPVTTRQNKNTASSHTTWFTLVSWGRQSTFIRECPVINLDHWLSLLRSVIFLFLPSYMTVRCVDIKSLVF
jgi:hypothetical protein